MSFELLNLLGRGGFATAFEAVVIGQANSPSVVIKTATLTSILKDRKHEKQLCHMTNEVNMLRLLSQSINVPQHSSSSSSSSSSTRASSSAMSNTSGSAHIQSHVSSLLHANWECSEQQLFLPILPVGIPLHLHASDCNKKRRIELAPKLKQNLLDTLQVVHRLGYCHCDLRPDNVIFSPVHESYVIIDWGLGCESYASFHGYFGGLPFFHDDIVRSHASDNEELKPAYKPEYDIASAMYVVYAFALGMKLLTVPWAKFKSEELIEARNSFVHFDS